LRVHLGFSHPYANFQIVQPFNIEGGKKSKEGGTSSGRSRWHVDGAYPSEPEGGDKYEQIFNFDPVFKAYIDTGNLPPGTAIAVFARAKVDKDWATSAANVGPAGLGPASHIVNARTNPSYFASNAGKVIHGREYGWWYSDPITVVVGDAKEAGIVTAVHMNARFAGSAGFADTLSRPTYLRGIYQK
jgi:hypothetical protein